ncbi:hypothetical protein AAZX31_05G078400 [Glycine max]|nr:hypothetical protein GLYMA_05G088550v4 [Glycine max]KAH1133379.1 hypothetical protein GYH30_011982 [Glycine max]
MDSQGYPPGLVLHPQVLGLPCATMKGYQTFFPSLVAKADLIRYQSRCLEPSPCQESTKSQNEWFDYNKFVNVDFSVERRMLIDDQKTLRNLYCILRFYIYFLLFNIIKRGYYKTFVQ